MLSDFKTFSPPVTICYKGEIRYFCNLFGRAFGVSVLYSLQQHISQLIGRLASKVLHKDSQMSIYQANLFLLIIGNCFHFFHCRLVSKYLITLPYSFVDYFIACSNTVVGLQKCDFLQRVSYWNWIITLNNFSIVLLHNLIVAQLVRKCSSFLLNAFVYCHVSKCLPLGHIPSQITSLHILTLK
jgi:hypothetical protein